MKPSREKHESFLVPCLSEGPSPRVVIYLPSRCDSPTLTPGSVTYLLLGLVTYNQRMVTYLSFTPWGCRLTTLGSYLATSRACDSLPPKLLGSCYLPSLPRGDLSIPSNLLGDLPTLSPSWVWLLNDHWGVTYLNPGGGELSPPHPLGSGDIPTFPGVTCLPPISLGCGDLPTSWRSDYYPLTPREWWFTFP